MTKAKRLALIIVLCAFVAAAIVGVSFAVWSNLESEKVFTLKAGKLELNISSSDVQNSAEKIAFGKPVTMSFKIKVEGEKSTLRFSVNSFQYCLSNGEFLPLSEDLFNIEVPKTMYGIGGDTGNDTVTCVVKVSLTDVYDYDSFDPVLMGKKFRFNIRVTAETYQNPTLYDIIYHNVEGAANDNIDKWSVETNYTFNEPTKTGYEFLGWFKDETLAEESRITELYQDDANISALNLYAKWQTVPYTITYDLGAGGTISNQPETYDIETYIDLEQYAPVNTDPTKLFGGYYTDAELTNRITEINVGTTGDITLYTKWVQQYNVTYIDALGAPNDNATVFSALDNAIALNALTMEGYTFDGWYNAEGIKVEAIDTTIESDITLTAQWTANKYAITWDFAGGDAIDGIITEYTYAANQSIAEYVPVRKGYTFDGWYLGGAKITEIPTDTINAITITASWTINTYSITWNADGGLLTGAPTDYNVESTPIDPSAYAPAKNGYTFGGWYTDAVLTTPAETIAQGSTGDKAFYAKWDIITYNITWNEDGGLLTGAPTDYNVESTAIDPSAYAPTKNGYTFGGWYTDAALTTPAETIVQGSTGDKAFYAKWDIITYNITWNSDNGTLADGTPNTFTIESTAIDPSAYAPTKNGYTFGGWYSDAALTTPAETIAQGSTGDKAFFAKWTANTYAIMWDYAGGDAIDGIITEYTYAANQSIAEYVPVRNGYTFDGWYLGGAKITAIPTDTINDITITAKWKAILYNIKWNSDNGFIAGDIPIYYTIESEAIDPSAYIPTKNGYKFVGWYSDAGLMTPAEIIAQGSTGDKSFFGKWEIITYSITWNTDGGTLAGQPTSFNVTTPAIDLTQYTPVKDGFTFVEWQIDGAKATEIPQGTTSDVTVTAVWEAVVIN